MQEKPQFLILIQSFGGDALNLRQRPRQTLTQLFDVQRRHLAGQVGEDHLVVHRRVVGLRNGEQHIQFICRRLEQLDHRNKRNAVQAGVVSADDATDLVFFTQAVHLVQQSLAVTDRKWDDLNAVEPGVLFQVVLHLHCATLTGHAQRDDDRRVFVMGTPFRLCNVGVKIPAAAHGIFVQSFQRTGRGRLAGAVHCDQGARYRHCADLHTGLLGDYLCHGA